MRNYKLSDKILLIIGTVATASFIAILIIALASGGKNTSSSTIGGVIPEKSTTKDVEKQLGKPASIKKTDNGSLFLYSTKSEDYKDVVSIENGKVKYSIENVFDSTKGTISDYKNKYGNPDFSLFDPNDESLIWNIFLKGGVGIATFDNEGVAKIVYFQPQSKEEFLKNISSQLNLKTKRPINPDE